VVIKIFGAGDARSNVQKLIKAKLNYQRRYIMERIEGASLNGRSQIVLDDPEIKLFEDDYKFFENLGYEVTRDTYIRYCMIDSKKEYYSLTYGIIYWD
jgi:hypothetical protein